MLPSPLDEYLGPNVSAAHGSKVQSSDITDVDDLEGGPLLDYTTALTLTVAIGLSLLVLNVILFAALLYRRDRNQLGAKINYDSVSVQPLCTVDSGLRSGSGVGQEGITPPGKEMMTTCTADIQVTELHTFPTPPDIGDRNTEVTSYTTGSGNKRHGCSGIPTSQFVPPPPLLTSTSGTHSPHIEGDMITQMGGVMSCSTVGVMSSPCTSSVCYNEGASSPYRAEVTGTHFSEIHIPVNPNQNFPVNVSSGGMSQTNTNPVSSGNNGTSTSGIPQCTAGGTCPGTGQQNSTFIPPSQYCSDYPVSQYSSERFVSTPSHYSSSTCQFSSNDNSCSFSNQPQRQSGSSGGQRSATLNRTNSSASGSPNPVCMQGSRKPKPPPRDSSEGSGFATLPRQSSLDSSTHIIA